MEDELLHTCNKVSGVLCWDHCSTAFASSPEHCSCHKKVFSVSLWHLFSYCDLFFYSQRLIVNSHPESEQETIWELQLSSVVLVKRGLEKKMLIHFVSLDDNSSCYSFLSMVCQSMIKIVISEDRTEEYNLHCPL